MTDDELEAQPPTRPLTSRPTGATKPRMAKPADSGLKEITPKPPQPRAQKQAAFDLTPDEPYDSDELVEVEPIQAQARADAKPDLELEPEPEPQAVAEPEPAPVAEAASPAQSGEPDLPATVRETLKVVDESWRAFYSMAARFPSERMDEHLSEDGWTRKQMLFHIAAWHDLTADRLIKFLTSGQPPEFDQDTDQFNAMAARRAIGKTAGEVLNDTEATFNRLRRQLQRLSDPQLREFDQWAAWVIRGNTYGHYEEHWQDVFLVEPPRTTRR